MSEELNFSYQRFDCSHSISSMTWRVSSAFQHTTPTLSSSGWIQLKFMFRSPTITIFHPSSVSETSLFPLRFFVLWISSNSNGKLERNATFEGIRHTQHVSICFCFHSLSAESISLIESLCCGCGWVDTAKHRAQHSRMQTRFLIILTFECYFPIYFIVTGAAAGVRLWYDVLAHSNAKAQIHSLFVFLFRFLCHFLWCAFVFFRIFNFKCFADKPYIFLLPPVSVGSFVFVHDAEKLMLIWFCMCKKALSFFCFFVAVPLTIYIRWLVLAHTWRIHLLKWDFWVWQSDTRKQNTSFAQTIELNP